MTQDQSATTSRSPLIWLFAGCLAALACVACVALLGTAALFVYRESQVAELPTSAPTAAPTTLAVATATLSPTRPAPPNPLLLQGTATASPSPTPEAPHPALALAPPAVIVQEPVAPQLFSQMEALLALDYPVHDFYETARRLSNYDVGPRTVTAEPFAVGDRQRFFTDDSTVEAVLLAVTEHAYFWVDESLRPDPIEVAAAAERFEQEYYPRLVNLFGSEWQPGVDNDPHFSVLHLNDLESSTDELGHFDSGDEYPRSFYSVSNQQEIIYLHMGNLTLGSDLYFGTLVHEFQHLAQWYVDGNESAWLDEGLSQLGELYVGLDTAETADYLLAPDTQLTSWDYNADDVYAHYAASYLFSVYLWEQLGEAAIQELARHPANGVASVTAVLSGYAPDLSLEQLFANWAAANYLDDSAAGAQYSYETLDLRPAVAESGVKYTPYEMVRDLAQYGVHYVELDTEGEVTLSFAGDTLAELLPVPPHSGKQVWFAPAQENLNAQLTGHFDLTGLDAATLSFWTWYDLKYDLDYAYVSISTDGGASWELLAPQKGQSGEYGPSFNGRSSNVPGADKGGWIHEELSLDAYAGQPVLIRFELLTYFDSQALGFALDDIAIPELGYSSDAETGADGWEAAGFAQVGRWLPQQWSLQYIRNSTTAAGAPRVQTLALDSFNQGQWTLDVGAEGGVLVLMPLTPFVSQPASYWLYIE